jgi:hypothetical protein
MIKLFSSKNTSNDGNVDELLVALRPSILQQDYWGKHRRGIRKSDQLTEIKRLC